MPLPPRLAPIVDGLLAAHAEEIAIDAIGAAIGVVAVTADDVEAILTALERAGRRVVGPEGQRGAANLRRVLPAARALQASLGRRPTLLEIAAACGMSVEDVRHALALGSVMGR